MFETLLESQLSWTGQGISHKMKGQHPANGPCRPSYPQAEPKEFFHQPFRGASLEQLDPKKNKLTLIIELCLNFNIKFVPKRQPSPPQSPSLVEVCYQAVSCDTEGCEHRRTEDTPLGGR